jgi:hypothetical protein
MFCPECGSGFREGFTRCSECDVDLVSSPPAEPDHSAEYVPLTTAQGQLEISQLQSFLESNGIPTELRWESAGNLYGITVNDLSSATVLVPREQASAAFELLEQARHGELALGPEEIE